MRAWVCAYACTCTGEVVSYIIHDGRMHDCTPVKRSRICNNSTPVLTDSLTSLCATCFTDDSEAASRALTERTTDMTIVVTDVTTEVTILNSIIVDGVNHLFTEMGVC